MLWRNFSPHLTFFRSSLDRQILIPRDEMYLERDAERVRNQDLGVWMEGVTAPVFEALSPGQVFVAGSWASWGIGFQLQRSTPVRVSNARTTPLGTSTRSLSEILEPTITKSSMIAGGEVSSYSPSRRMFLIPWRRLIWPAVPKSPHGLPVAASKQIKRASMVAINMRRLDRLVGLLSGPVVENVI